MGTKLNTYAIGDVDLTNIMAVLDQTRIGGVMQVSLTNLSSTAVPAIAAGSFLEVAGALYLVSTEEAISTTDPVTSAPVADGFIYIMAIPSGNSISFSFTATAPTWSDAKQGWYGTGTYAGCRYLDYYIKKATSSYAKSQRTNKSTLRFINLIQAYGELAAQSGYILFTTKYHDFLNEVSNDTITIAVSGLYEITGFVRLAAGSNFTGGSCDISINNSYPVDARYALTGMTLNSSSWSGVGMATIPISGCTFLNAGDVIKLSVTCGGSSGSQHGLLIIKELF